jgi:co-chaperonin GroES (HSP10)
MEIKMQNGYIAVVKAVATANKDASNPYLATMALGENTGEVVYAEDSCLVGTRVYFSKDFERLVINGKDLLVMKPANIIAIIKD